MNIDELITALEQATEPSRELDARIRKAAFGDFAFCGDHEGGSWCGDCANDDCGAPVGMVSNRTSLPSNWEEDEFLPNYTTSIDAAKTTVPEGHTWACGSANENDEPWACVTSPLDSDEDGGCKDYDGSALNEATALVIASLKARKAAQ